MSRQVNFYAAPADTEMIHRWLLSEFPSLTLVSQRKGPREHSVPIDASEPGAFWRYPVSCLIPLWARPLLHVRDLAPDFPGQFSVSAKTSPVIEYCPCDWEEVTSTVTRSRFYWSYSGELPAEATSQLNKLFRWVRQNTVAVEGPFFRFFPIAAQTARFARQHLTWKPEPNPLFQRQNLGHTAGGS